jgi:hypothetical protein
MRYGFHDIGGHQDLEAKQERATDADLVDFGILGGQNGARQRRTEMPNSFDFDSAALWNARPGAKGT